MNEQIPLFEIAWDQNDVSNVVESISRGGYWAKGPFVDSFESELESYLGVDHAVVVNSGTTALVAALEAAGISSGDEVIVPSFTFIATANAVRMAGGEPVFADIETETYGLDPVSVREQVTDRTAAVLPVHLYGTPCRIRELMDIAEAEDLVVIEDAAEAFGSAADGTYAGTFGDAGALSFCQNKIIVTGEGGAVITDDDDLAHRVRLYRSHGRDTADYFDSAGSGEYIQLGTNVRMSDMTAALGCAQLEKVNELIGGRRGAAAHLSAGLADVDGVRTPAPRADATHVYQLYTVELASRIDRREVIETLAEHGVSSKVYWDTPVHRTVYYRETTSEPTPDLPNTDAAANRVLSLPIYPDLTPSQADRIVEAVRAAV